MVRFLLSAAFLSISALSAQAGGIADEPPAPVIVPAPVVAPTGFDGPYVGLEFGTAGIDAAETSGPFTPFGDLGVQDGDVIGIFAGYNWQRGSLVYGAEARRLNFSGTASILNPGETIEGVTDLRGRVGLAAGDALFYAAAGYSIGELDLAPPAVDLDGFNLGIGMEYNINPRWFLGVDFTARDLEGEAGGFTYEVDLNTVTLRAGFRF